ncbi:Na+/solute symporter [Alicyclobacillus hesperidum URH17-3-68]|nr:Na+/solute symporter [Alicyclobacillus hesperidum URH17-3-68]
MPHLAKPNKPDLHREHPFLLLVSCLSDFSVPAASSPYTNGRLDRSADLRSRRYVPCNKRCSTSRFARYTWHVANHITSTFGPRLSLCRCERPWRFLLHTTSIIPHAAHGYFRASSRS